MKGMIFTEFLEMVEERFGLATVEKILEQAAPENEGAYTSVGNYHHEEMVRLVVALSETIDIPTDDLLQVFGRWVFLRLFVEHYGDFFVEPGTVFEFLTGIESYIHVEVRKLYPDAELPTFETERVGDHGLNMVYRSTRPFAQFAHGLVLGCIEHYGENITVEVKDLSQGQGTSAQFVLSKEAAAA